MDLGLRGKWFVVIGGSRGMGRSVAEVLAEEGANLAIVARDQQNLDRVAAELNQKHAVEVRGIAADASVPGAMQEAIEALVESGTDVAGLAACSGPMQSYGELHTQSDEEFDFYYQNVFMPTVRSARAVVPHLIARGGGTIVTLAAYSTRAQKPVLPHYTAMKSALVSVTKNMSKAYGKHGIRVNCVCPGMIETPLMHELIDPNDAIAKYGGTKEEALYRYTADVWGMNLSLQRCGQPEEVGELVAFLLSERAAYLTGATINIDGGTDFF
jgi:NAD(P)-dependent dehydrogenase (short-subunit alcohol dehydrogenase family)